MALPFRFESKTLIEEERTTQSAINEIKNWLKTTNLPQIQDEFIVLFLISCLNNISDTQKTIQAYFRIKNRAPAIFNNCSLDDENMMKALEVLYNCVLPVRMNNNTVIWFAKLNDTNYRNFNYTYIIKLYCMLVHFCQIFNPPNELIIVFDAQGFGLMHFTRLKLDVVKTFLEYIQEGMPLKIRNIHILNANFVIDKLLSLLKIFINSELLAGIKLHSPGISMAQFHNEWIPASCLPKEYGGHLPCIEALNAQMVEEIRQIRSFYQAEETLRSFQR